MSSHSFRSFVLCFVVLLNTFDMNVNAFAIRSAINATNAPLHDLTAEGSLQLEARQDFKRPNGLDGNVSNKNDLSTIVNDLNVKRKISSAVLQAATTDSAQQLNSTVSDIIDTISASLVNVDTLKNLKSPKPFTAQSLPKSTYDVYNTFRSRYTSESSDLDNAMAADIKNTHTNAGSTAVLNTTGVTIVNSADTDLPADETVGDLNYYNSTEPQGTETSYRIEDNFSYENLPPWKRYTSIDRRRVTGPESTLQPEQMANAESRVTVKGSITSNSISSDQVTKHVTHATMNSENELTTQEVVTDTESRTASEIPKLEALFSKRAGFLNLSLRSQEIASTPEDIVSDLSLTDYNTTTTSSDDLEEHIIPSFGGTRPQSYLTDDAIKEVLLEETSLNNNQEYWKQTREVIINNTVSTDVTIDSYNTDTTMPNTDSALKTDVIDTEITTNGTSSLGKSKSTNLYAVNPNYKPMKKIEVQPPKIFVRDPDDNSWRNESISSLGIVFKPKNSSKPFTQVLKNRTETEWGNALSRDNKNGVPDLRERLENIALKRKTKKKKADTFGNIVYTDYEESNSSEEITNTEGDVTPIISTEEITTSSVSTWSTPTMPTSPLVPNLDTVIDTTTITPLNETSETSTPFVPTIDFLPSSSNNITNTTENILKGKAELQTPTTLRGKKVFNVFDYYDNTDDDENEYLELAKLELKKFTQPLHVADKTLTTSPPLPYQFTKPLTQYLPDRKPTLQFFPPLSANQRKPNRLDNEFEKKIKANMKKVRPTQSVYITTADTPLGTYQTQYPEEHNTLRTDHTLIPFEEQIMYKVTPTLDPEFTRNHYQSTASQITTAQNNRFAETDANVGFNRASYVIKNYKDFLEQAVKDYDYERDVDFASYTEAPVRGVTISDLIAQDKDRFKPKANINYDYDAKFRKDVLQRFVDNFSHNEARYNADFPVLYNNSVMHVNVAGNAEAVASSRAFLKGLYSPSDTKLGYARKEPYDPNCDNGTVELSPAYELHYYVPDQEEKEEVEPK